MITASMALDVGFHFFCGNSKQNSPFSAFGALLVKPFNPLLGESFEYVDEKKDLFFHSEQVSHHPPIGASHCETPNWVYYQTQSVKTKFLGNSLDVTPIGVAHVVLKKYNEHYQWPNIKTLVHNLIIGRMWVDHFGPCPVTVTKNDTNEPIPIKGDLKYKQCGWFGRGWHEIEGFILRLPDGAGGASAPGAKKSSSSSSKSSGEIQLLELSGKWTEQVSATATDHGKNLVDTAQGLTFNTKTPTVVWKHTNGLTQDPTFIKHEWSDVTVGLVTINDEILRQIPLTDARLREDRYFLQLGDIKKASSSKHALEEAQRARKKNRDAAATAAAPSTWQARYFEVARTADGSVAKNSLGDDQWVSKGNYWKVREARIAANQAANKAASLEDSAKLWRQQRDWK